MKKWMGLLALSAWCLCLLGGCAETAAVPETSRTQAPPVVERGLDLSDHTVEEYILCAQQDGLSLYVQPSTTAFYVETAAGERWFSCPEERGEDWFADGIYKMEMSSLLIVNYVDTDNGESSRFNTATGSVYDDAYELRTLDTGFRVDYTFPEYAVTIPLCVYLESGALKAEVLLSEVQYPQDSLFLSSIVLLPFFGAGSEKDEGYLFVADGEGGIIRFNNGKYTSEPYVRPIYGQEPSELPESYDLSVEDTAIRMPVFGIRRNAAAFLAVVEEGAACGSLRAYTNLQQTGYANVYTDFSVKSQMDYSLGSVKTPLYESGGFTQDTLRIYYRFLSGEDADYSGMARAYRAYLLEQGTAAKANSEPALYLNVVGGVAKTVSHLGIRGERVTPLTTLEQVGEITSWLEQQGVEQTVIRYTDWNKQELAGKTVSAFSVAGALKSGGCTLDSLTNAHVTLYPSLESFFTFDKAGFIKKTFGTASDISGVALRWKNFSPGLGTGEGDSIYRLSAAERRKALDRLTDCITGAGRVALADIGNSLYNDFRQDGCKRDEMSREIARWLASQSGELLLSNPNVYAAVYARQIINAPIQSSGQDLIDASVPFYGIVMSGLKDYAGQAINACGDDAFLRTVESGSMPTYTWIYEDASLLKNTQRSELSGCGFQLSREQAVQAYGAVCAIHERAEGTALYAHTILADGVTVTRYENGACVYVNFRYEDYTLEDGTVLQARSYRIG